MVSVSLPAFATKFLSTPSARRATALYFLSKTPPMDFYPRPPRGGRRWCVPCSRRCGAISIHALREEGDRPTCFRFYHFMDFYPRPPRGGRRSSSSLWARCRANFYPRPPRGGRRRAAGVVPPVGFISIHALREEGDSSVSCSCGVLSVFLSTPSARRATLFLHTAKI